MIISPRMRVTLFPTNKAQHWQDQNQPWPAPGQDIHIIAESGISRWWFLAWDFVLVFEDHENLLKECLRPADLRDGGRVFVLLDTVGRLGNAMSTLAILIALRVSFYQPEAEAIIQSTLSIRRMKKWVLSTKDIVSSEWAINLSEF